MLSDIKVKDLQVHYTPCTARTPLKFGAVVVEQLDFCKVKATVENQRGNVAEVGAAFSSWTSGAGPTRSCPTLTRKPR